MAKDSFILFKEHEEIFVQLSKEQAGNLILAIFEYERTEIVPEFKEACTKLAFIPIRQSLDRSREKYKETCEKNSQNAQKRWNAKNQNEYDRIKQNANNADSDSEPDSDLTNSNYSEIEKRLNLIITRLTDQRYKELLGVYTARLISNDEAIKRLDDILLQYDGWRANNSDITNDFPVIRKWIISSFENEKQTTKGYKHKKGEKNYGNSKTSYQENKAELSNW